MSNGSRRLPYATPPYPPQGHPFHPPPNAYHVPSYEQAVYTQMLPEGDDDDDDLYYENRAGRRRASSLVQPRGAPHPSTSAFLTSAGHAHGFPHPHPHSQSHPHPPPHPHPHPHPNPHSHSHSHSQSHQPYPANSAHYPPSHPYPHHPPNAPPRPPGHHHLPHTYQQGMPPHPYGIPPSPYQIPEEQRYPASPPRPYMCELCPLSFNRQHDLNRHRDTHSGQRPFSCNGGCGKTFTRRDALKRHQVVKQCGGDWDSRP